MAADAAWLDAARADDGERPKHTISEQQMSPELFDAIF